MNLNILYSRLIAGILILTVISCKKKDNIDFESIYPDLFPLNDTVNYIFPPQKFKIILNTPQEITCYYTTISPHGPSTARAPWPGPCGRSTPFSAGPPPG